MPFCLIAHGSLLLVLCSVGFSCLQLFNQRLCLVLAYLRQGWSLQHYNISFQYSVKGFQLKEVKHANSTYYGCEILQVQSKGNVLHWCGNRQKWDFLSKGWFPSGIFQVISHRIIPYFTEDAGLCAQMLFNIISVWHHECLILQFCRYITAHLVWLRIPAFLFFHLIAKNMKSLLKWD